MDMVYFILGAVAQMDLTEVHRNMGGTGSAPYPPAMLPALLVDGDGHGIFFSGKIERASYREVLVALSERGYPS